MNNHIAFIFCLMICCVSFSQTKLSGNLYSEDSTSISDANILILEYYSNKYITSTKTDNRGFFQFSKALDIGVYNIEVSRLGFSKLKQTLVIEKDSKAALTLDLFMTTSELSKLDEVIVQSKPPVIVKKDTIIYDIEHHTEAYDENLEQVLSRLEGFEIQANGDIKVNGKIINKILIDGKEVSDMGNAMLTKSLSPEELKI
ncbi:carboxypeptidase-like regulatory domain-containing protein [Psychroflexus aestuariivivens]|uniref:carboxypeptidase-like regulatory domain-containing protein n=1 Tax=Psychroflexus aestuariivivens TaxID=1795040 RepID=UPI000FD76439|nr:carboxypeptidase-like regulatory domain-containing protein [Psychroflexus aestuariivivens]